MTDVLARLKVSETHGIRRFLYPLWTTVSVPEGTEAEQLSLTLRDGTPVPLEVEISDCECILDFALSLAPHEELELLLTTGTSHATIPDPLHVTIGEDGCSLVSVQERFQVRVGPDALLQEVIYDNIAHLRGPLRIDITPPDEETSFRGTAPFGGPLSASSYLNTRRMCTITELTACKSWVDVHYARKRNTVTQEIVFTLPFAATSPTLTCDFGVGGGIYGKLQQGAADEIIWRTEFCDNGSVEWSVATDGRIDYVGQCDTAERYLGQQWLHVIDKDKAIAVAITSPDCSTHMTVMLRHTGEISIAFKIKAVEMQGTGRGFGVCYHFLNDVPAIAAATNPQSILLPPVVEVLPA